MKIEVAYLRKGRDCWWFGGLTQSASESDASEPLDTRRNFHNVDESGYHVDGQDRLAHGARDGVYAFTA
jgi:hypothetical protein